MWKKAKKIVKVVAPIAINFIPGIGPLAKAALTTVAGKASGLSTKQALLGGALSYGGSKLFGGTPAAGTAGNATSTGGNIFSRAGEFLTKGKDGVGLFGNLGKGLGSMKEYAFKGKDGVGLFGNLGKGLGGLFGGGPQVPEGLEIGADGMYVDAAGNTYGYQDLVDMGVMDRSGNIINTPQADLSNQGMGSFFGNKTPGFIKGIEDTLKGQTDPNSNSLFRNGGNMFGGNMGAAALAALLGKVTYDAAKERSGGLADTPAVSMDQLGRYQLSRELGTGGTRGEFGLPAAQKALEFNMGGPVYGYNYGGPVRQYFNKGGLALVQDLDMRDGGESDGPGTGTSDDIPAMLSDGEFVMTAKATKGAGAFGVNKTKSGIELIKGGSPSRKKGVENMRELMNIFEAI
jgi:hypothetical protein